MYDYIYIYISCNYVIFKVEQSIDSKRFLEVTIQVQRGDSQRPAVNNLRITNKSEISPWKNGVWAYGSRHEVSQVSQVHTHTPYFMGYRYSQYVHSHWAIDGAWTAASPLESRLANSGPFMSQPPGAVPKSDFWVVHVPFLVDFVPSLLLVKSQDVCDFCKSRYVLAQWLCLWYNAPLFDGFNHHLWWPTIHLRNNIDVFCARNV